MSEYIIVANNTCDLPEEILNNLDITILPLGFNIGDESYKSMPPKEFFQKIREGAMPTTNAGNIGEFTDIAEPALAAGKDVLIIAFSAAMSTTYNSAVLAAEELSEKYPDRTILVVDSASASVGEGYLVRGAAEQRLAGKAITEVRDWLENTKGKIAHWVAVNDLGHLKRGGRISAAQAVVGGMLGVKPILRINEEGGLVSFGKERGRQASLQKLMSQLEKTGVNLTEETVYISHADCLDEAEALAKQIKEKLGVKDIVISYIGPVIGSHTGLGVIAVCHLANGREG